MILLPNVGAHSLPSAAMRCLAVVAVVVLAACSAPTTGAKLDGGPGDGGKKDGAAPHDAPLADVGGGAISELRFAIVGDTRPPSEDDTSAYPTAIITKIWQDVEATSPHPQFAISTGDYMFASVTGSQQQAQLNIYMTARAAYTGLQYPAMGNHECTGATDSDCGPGSRDGITANMGDFVTTMLHPIGVTLPYYTEHFTATDGTWTAKLVVVACNAWSSTQSTWLSNELAQASTYTFVVRHEGVDSLTSTPTPPCVASQSIITSHPLTLLIAGHTHKYAHYASDHEIIVGNGGAPLVSGTNYGYVIVSRNASGTLTVTAYDYMTKTVIETFTIQASGAAA
jgi:hypothetical protein